MADRETIETLDALERAARAGSQTAENDLWRIIAGQSTGTIKLRGRVYLVADMVPEMFIAWKRGRDLASCLDGIRRGHWIRRDMTRHSQETIPEEHDLKHPSVPFENKLHATIDSLVADTDLTDEEREVVEMIRAGYMNKEMAERFGKTEVQMSRWVTEIIGKISDSVKE